MKNSEWEREQTMKTYIIKDRIINIKTGDIRDYYFGKDGYLHDFDCLEYCDGYLSIKGAYNRIKNEFKSYIRKLDDMHGIESDNWLHIYEIIEYVKGE